MDPVSYGPLPSAPTLAVAPSAPPLESSRSDDDQIHIYVIQRPEEVTRQNRNWGVYCGFILVLLCIIFAVLYSLSHFMKPKN